MSALEAIVYDKEGCKLRILDQLLLPHQSQFMEVRGVEEAWQAIRKMQVRGAPAIAIVAALGLTVELRGMDLVQTKRETGAAVASWVKERLEYLKTSRPTAVNLSLAAKALSAVADEASGVAGAPGAAVVDAVGAAAEAMFDADIKDNRAIGSYGAKAILAGLPTGAGGAEGKGKVRVLTHCNTGSLATAAYGTALGVIRRLHELERVERAYCTETRPYNQGARLTAYELVHEEIPATLITDSMAAALMRTFKLAAVVVGADRVTRNGDTANKIGTYQLAIVARHHGVPFYVAAPSTSIDLEMASGSEIPIEERPHNELTSVQGIKVAADGIGSSGTGWGGGRGVPLASIYLISLIGWLAGVRSLAAS